jgi:hypothetical protein
VGGDNAGWTLRVSGATLVDLAWRQCVGRAPINRFTQGFSGLEMGHPFFRDGHALATARVTAHARRPAIDGKTAEPPDFNPVSSYQRIVHGVKDGLDSELRVAMGQLAKPVSQLLNEIRSGHCA